ncbi:ribulose-phosphate 3-epimerase [Candidatus Peribacteria bacterium]|nr:ribulose-phosphate 3-epimerase [Candidatus Peribacteria bacterium]
MQKIIIASSILSANFQKLQEEIESVEPYSDWLQVDVMDGHFVPNLSFGAPVVKWIETKLPIDIHLMVENPANRIDEFAELGCSHITFHAEAVPGSDDQKDLIGKIRKKGCTAGIAINPDTPISDIENIMTEVDLALLMTVQPGFGGQSFRTEVLEKIKELRKKVPELMIQVDGGINEETAAQCIEAGANNLVAGSYIFGADDREAAIQSLRG